MKIREIKLTLSSGKDGFIFARSNLLNICLCRTYHTPLYHLFHLRRQYALSLFFIAAALPISVVRLLFSLPSSATLPASSIFAVCCHLIILHRLAVRGLPISIIRRKSAALPWLCATLRILSSAALVLFHLRPLLSISPRVAPPFPPSAALPAALFHRVGRRPAGGLRRAAGGGGEKPSPSSCKSDMNGIFSWLEGAKTDPPSPFNCINSISWSLMLRDHQAA